MDLMSTTQLLGNLGEFLGSIAVFATLAYVAVQVRYTKRELNRSVAQARASTTIQLQQNRVLNVDLRHAYLKTGEQPFVQDLAKRFGLTIDEADMLHWDRIAYWQYHSHTVSYIAELPAEERVAFDVALRAQYSSPFVAVWYEGAKQLGILNRNTVEYVDALVEQA